MSPALHSLPNPPYPTTPPPPGGYKTFSGFSLLLRQTGGVLQRLAGLPSILLLLALSASIPVLNLLALGYLLESSGRVAKSGQLRHGLPGWREASIIGLLAGFASFLFLPARFMASARRDALLIDPGAAPARITQVLLALCMAGAVICLVLALLFLAALGAPGRGLGYSSVRDGVLAFIGRLRLLRLLRTGFFALLGGILWLLPPFLFLSISTSLPADGKGGGGGMFAIAGCLALGVGASILPHLQTQFAIERDFRVFLRPNLARQAFVHAPISHTVALLITLGLAAPLFLLKIACPSPELAWLPALPFVTAALLSRIALGWAASRARHTTRPAHPVLNWTMRGLVLPICTGYVLMAYLSQFIIWTGVESLLEQHAFLIPAPILR